MVVSIITEHPRIEPCFITSPSGFRGYPNYRPAFSHIKKVVLPKTSHLNKGWIRKSFAFFSTLHSFLKDFQNIFPPPLVFCFMLGCSGLLQWFCSPTLRRENTLTCGFLERQWWMKHLLGARYMYVCVIVDACVCLCVWARRNTAMGFCLSSQTSLSDKNTDFISYILSICF